MKAVRIVLALVLLTVLVSVLVYRFGIARTGADDGLIRVSGNIELTAVEVSFKVPGLVSERRFDEGQETPRGEVVAVLESSDLKAEVALRTAELKGAEALWEEVKNGSRDEEKKAAEAAMRKAAEALAEMKSGSRQQEIDAAKAAMESAAVEVRRAADEFERAKRLFSTGAITTETHNSLKAAYETAEGRHRESSERYELVRIGPRDEQIRQAEAAYDQARWQHALVMAGPREEVHKQAQARVEQARATLQLAETRLGFATAYAPRQSSDPTRSDPRWIVLSKSAEAGEYVAPGTPVLTLGDMRNVWLRAYVDESDLPRVKAGQTKARVTVDGQPGQVYDGVVAFVAEEAEFTPKNVQTLKERTRLVYRIKINIDNPDLELKRGMPADAELLVGS